MKANKKQNKVIPQPLVVPATVVARMVSCSARYIHLLAESGEIPSYRFGKRCIRFNVEEVLRAMGIKTEAVATGAKS